MTTTTDMTLAYQELLRISQLWYRKSRSAPSSQRQKRPYFCSTTKDIASAPTLVELESASTHPSADRPRTRACRSAQPVHLTTPTYQRSKRHGGYHRSIPTTQEHQTCSRPLLPLVPPTVPHHPSQQVSQHLRLRPS